MWAHVNKTNFVGANVMRLRCAAAHSSPKFGEPRLARRFEARIQGPRDDGTLGVEEGREG